MFLIKDLRDGKEYVSGNKLTDDIIYGFCKKWLKCGLDDVEVYIPTEEQEADLQAHRRLPDGDVIAENGKLVKVTMELEDVEVTLNNGKKRKVKVTKIENGRNIYTQKVEVQPKRVKPVYERDEAGLLKMDGRGKPVFKGNKQK